MESARIPQREHSPQNNTELIQNLNRTEQEFTDAEPRLPMTYETKALRTAIQTHDRILVEADTGSGKTVFTPIVLLQEALKTNPDARVAVTQPRRVPVEDQNKYLGKNIGKKYVGMRHGDAKTTNMHTRLEFLVEKSLLNDLLKDPELKRYDVVMLDEVHERSIDMDILMPLLKDAQKRRQQLGKPLKVVLASATVDHEKLLKYFEGAKHVHAEGRMYTVENHFSPIPIKESDVMVKASEKAAEIIAAGESEYPGDLLIFMPGKGEIAKTIDDMKLRISDPNIEYVQLIGGADSRESSEKLREESDKRRIFVSTNVAETSVTIPSVRIVIDSGLEKKMIFDPNTGLSSLQLLEHAQSNALQRRGRAGRKASGHAFFLFTEKQFNERPKHLSPEILTSDLAAQVLMMKKLNLPNPETFDFLDHPGPEKIRQAISTLQKLDALNPDGSISDIGKEMAEMELDPRLARMMVEAKKLGCQEAVGLFIGKLQNTKLDVFDRYVQNFSERYKRFLDPQSDAISLLKAWNEYIINDTSPEQREAWSEETGIKTWGLYMAGEERKGILGRGVQRQPVDLSPESIKKISRAIAVGLIDNIITKNPSGRGYRTASGLSNIQIGNTSVLNRTRPLPDMFVSGSIFKSKGGPAYASYNIAITPEMLRELSTPVAASPRIEIPVSPDKSSPLFPPIELKPPKIEPFFPPPPGKIPHFEIKFPNPPENLSNQAYPEIKLRAPKIEPFFPPPPPEWMRIPRQPSAPPLPQESNTEHISDNWFVRKRDEIVKKIKEYANSVKRFWRNK